MKPAKDDEDSKACIVYRRPDLPVLGFAFGRVRARFRLAPFTPHHVETPIISQAAFIRMTALPDLNLQYSSPRLVA